ncbi:MAG: ferritin family protein, partial [Dehalococcoidales bacterium]
MTKDLSYFKELLAHAIGLAGLLWVMVHLVLILVWDKVVISEPLDWVLYLEMAVTGLVIILVAERVVSHGKGFLMLNQVPSEGVMEIAIVNEKTGYTFYRNMAAAAKDNRVREIFTCLADRERVHAATFTTLKGQLSKYKSEQNGSAGDDRYKYIKHLRASGIFTGERATALTGISSDREAIDLGITHEKESILLYEGMRSSIPRRVLKVVDRLIGEEKEHLNQ